MSTRTRIQHVEVDTRSLKVALKFSGMSHAQLALKAGVSKAMIGNLASGARITCKADTAVKIAKALDLKPKDLFDLVITRTGATPQKVAA